MGFPTILGIMEHKYYFLPGNRWPWYSTYRVSVPLLYSISVVTVLGIIFSWYIGIYTPLVRARKKSQERYTHLKKAYDQEEIALHSFPTVQQRCKQLKVQLMPSDPHKLLSHTELSFLDTIRSQKNVQVVSFKPNGIIAKDDFVYKKVHFSITSTYDELLKVLSYKPKTPVYYQVNTLSINRLETGLLQASVGIEFKALSLKGL